MVVGLACLGSSQQQLTGAEPGTTMPPAQANSGQLKWVRKGSVPARGTTQHNLTVARSIDSRNNQTHSVAQAASPSQVTVLRWRTPSVAQARPTGAGDSQPTRMLTVSTGNRPQQHAVRQVSATEFDLPAAIPDASGSADAFNDPFNDGARRPQRPRTAPAPLPIEPAAPLIAQRPAPATLADTSFADDPPPAPQLSSHIENVSQQLPEPAPVQTFSETAMQQEMVMQQEQAAADEPCDRIYKRRDCCAEGERCTEARDRWQRDAISKISLDITPAMHPGEKGPLAQERERTRDLAQAPVRTWRDRRGMILAEGRLNNIKRGRVLVLDANNEIVRIPFNDLCDDDLCFLTAWWHVPTECTLGNQQFAGRAFAPSTLTWKASALCHKPLYFQEVQLERYGHTAGPVAQPFLSGAHFFMNLVTVPYQAGINPPWECRYSLGHYRPGSCAPWLVPPVPLSVRGALWQAGAVVGGVAIIP